VFRLYVTEQIAVSTPAVALACRVHEGSVRVGDRVRRAITPTGEIHNVDLEVRFLSMSETVHVDVLDTNYGGFVTLFGLYPQKIGDGWELTSSEH
jgi:hypothetical protein